MVGSLDVSSSVVGPKSPKFGLVGLPNESVVFVDEVSCSCLVDTGSMVTTISQEFLKSHFPSLPVFPVGDILTIKGPMDEELPYSGKFPFLLARVTTTLVFFRCWFLLIHPIIFGFHFY